MSNKNLETPFKELFTKLSNKQPLYRIIAGTIHHAIEENFSTEGKRVGGWPALKKSTLRKKRKKNGAKQILQFKGKLVKSIQQEATNEYAAVGTNLIYGKIHQHGGTINIAARSELFTRNRYKRGAKKGKFKKGTNFGKGFTKKKHTIIIPARPFLVLNDDDWGNIKSELIKYLIGH